MTFIIVQDFLIWDASPTSGCRRYANRARCVRYLCQMKPSGTRINVIYIYIYIIAHVYFVGFKAVYIIDPICLHGNGSITRVVKLLGGVTHIWDMGYWGVKNLGYGI